MLARFVKFSAQLNFQHGDKMRRLLTGSLAAVAVLVMATASPSTQSERAPAAASGGGAAPAKLAAYKQEVAKSIDGMYDLAQQMVDSVFSFSEIGFQEYETQRYVTGILEREGFTIQRGVAGSRPRGPHASVPASR